jgi:hypothetical protein
VFSFFIKNSKKENDSSPFQYLNFALLRLVVMDLWMEEKILWRNKRAIMVPAVFVEK